MLRLQMEFRHRKLHGMDVAVSSNIPVAAGMSSSSALVVSTAEAAVAPQRPGVHSMAVLSTSAARASGSSAPGAVAPITRR